MSLWLEGMKMTKADQPPRKARKRPRTATDDEAEEERSRDRKRSEVISLARRGLPGKAVQHASSMGLAPDTPATEATTRSKFVAPPPAQSTSRRVPAANLQRSERGSLNDRHSFVRSWRLCRSEWPATGLLQIVGGEWGQAGSPVAPWSLQSAGSGEGFRGTASVHWESRRHCSLQESERWL